MTLSCGVPSATNPMAAVDPRQISRLFPSRWHRIYTIAKLRSDPLYDSVYNELKSSILPLLDVGCGLGILAFYLRERGWDIPIQAIDYDKRKFDATHHSGAITFATSKR